MSFFSAIASPGYADLRRSNGSSPEIQAQQILAVAPILKGQTILSSPQSNGSNHQPTPSQQAPLAAQGNLIDFDEPTTATPPSQSTSNGGPIISSLHEPLQPGKPIHRVDTLTKDVDEFVDAKPL